MAHMPQWFMKTPEMVASDRWFSLGPQGTNGDVNALRKRYTDALLRLQGQGAYYSQSAAMNASMQPSAVSSSLGSHFRGDWIHAQYPQNQGGGLFWPQIASATVIEVVKRGTRTAIHKALGVSTLSALLAGVHPNIGAYVSGLYDSFAQDDVNPDETRPLSTSWVCVAPADSDFFQADAVRGPNVVDFVIATPKPIGNSPITTLLAAVPDSEAETLSTWGDTLDNVRMNDLADE